MREWFVVDPKHPWREIKIRNATIKSGEKLAWIEYAVKAGNRMDTKRSIVGMSAFPFMSGAIASQNHRCTEIIKRRGALPVASGAVDACRNRLDSNRKIKKGG